MQFKHLALGQRFVFDHSSLPEHMRAGLAHGPWVKLSARRYVKHSHGPYLPPAGCHVHTVGTVSVDVCPLPWSITVCGRRHADRNGNTYNTATIFVDGRRKHRTEPENGYGEHYLEVAAEWLESKGIITRLRHPCTMEALRWTCDRLGIVFAYHVSDVRRESDLTAN